MKLIHTVSWYFPHTSGGSEVFVQGLVQELQQGGIDSAIAAALEGKEELNYQDNGTEIYRYPVFPHPTEAQVSERSPHGGFTAFARWLEAHQGGLYHQHSWRFGCGWQHLSLAKKLGMPTVVTIHVPEAVCLRGTLMRNGEVPCDGAIAVARCGHCCGVPLRVPALAAEVLSQIPLPLATATQAKLLNSQHVQLRQLGRAIGTPPSVTAHWRKLLAMARLADRIVATCQWLYDALLANGVPPEKVILCRVGVSSNYRQVERPKKPQDAPLKIGFLGRWHETKGVQILVAAVQRLRAEIPVELVIHGMVHGRAGQVLRDRVQAIAASDRRIVTAEKLGREQVPTALAEFDLLAVPSQWLETGPLVVLESFAVGTPVLGSQLGGIAELVQHGVNGWLVPPTDVEAWKEAIAHLAQNRDLLAKLRQGIQPVRTMKEVAAEMVEIYQEIWEKGNEE